MSTTTDNCLIVFCRAPVLGQVKTRLATELGEKGALDAYRNLVDHAIAQVTPVAATKVLATTTMHPECERWAMRLGGEIVLQSGANLGERMHNAMAAQFQSGHKRVMLMGVDCPSLDAHMIGQGFEMLAIDDVVFAPAEDGGYGLIGSCAAQPQLFRDIEWGTANVLSRTLQLCRAENLSVGLLPQIWDVDDLAGWQRFAAD